MTNPKTVPELLDAAVAQDDGGQAFANVLNGIFTALEKAKDDE